MNQNTIVMRRVTNRKKVWGIVFSKLPFPFPEKLFSELFIRKLPFPFSRSESLDLFSVTLKMFVGTTYLEVTITVSGKFISEFNR